MNSEDLHALSMRKLRTLKHQVERRLYELETYYMRQGIKARSNDMLEAGTTVTECPYPLGTEEATLWQEGYDLG
jgi:hypothetical protein